MFVCPVALIAIQDLYAIDDDRSVLTHYTYDGSRFVVSQVRNDTTTVSKLSDLPGEPFCPPGKISPLK